MLRNWKAAIAGMVLLVLLQSMSLFFSTQTGYLDISFTTPTSIATTATNSPTQTSAAETLIPLNTSTPPFTITPVLTTTPIPSCTKHSKGVYIEISKLENNIILKSSDMCLMMSQGGGSVGKPVLGNLVNEKIKILNQSFEKYYEFVIPLRADKTTERGIYVEKDITFFEFAQNGLGWAQSDYEPGEYWFVMHFVASPTMTPTP